jgi:hypothetical protein
MKILLILIIFLSSVQMKCTEVMNIISKDGAEIVIIAGSSTGNKDSYYKFDEGSYSLNINSVSVIDGAYSGIWFEFIKELDKNNTLKFKIELPSGKKFKVYDKGRGEFFYETPGENFVLTPADFENIYSDHMQSFIKARVYAEKLTRTSPNSLSSSSVYFSDFTLSFSKFVIDGGMLNAACTIDAKTDSSDMRYLDKSYSLTGSFQLSGVAPGITNVD